MTQEEIINGSKLIAEYMNLVYLPFSAELKEKGMKAGWYETVSAEPNIQEVTQTSYKVGEEDKAEVKKINININLLRYHNKNGWTLVDDNYYKFICRKHSELRFWNSLDALVPVIQKIEKDYNVVIWITYNGAEHTDFADKKWKTKICQSYDKDLQLSNNVFKVVVETLIECKTWKIKIM